MLLRSKSTRVVRRENNVVLVDFTRNPEPPNPRFPGANALRNNAAEEVQLRLVLPRLVTTI